MTTCRNDAAFVTFISCATCPCIRNLDFGEILLYCKFSSLATNLALLKEDLFLSNGASTPCWVNGSAVTSKEATAGSTSGGLP